jgi:adenylate cyclase
MVEEIERRQGRVINTWGDGLLAEFASPVEAVSCAVEVQRRLEILNGGEAERPPMQFRIGINLGDVMVEGDDLYGEGVNVAARLESLAEPGGICISGTVFEQVRKKINVGFSFLGKREIKNIAEPVPAYHVLLDQKTEATTPRRTDDGASPGALRQPEVVNRAMAEWTRLAWRFGVILAGLIIINLLTSHRTLWFVWPMLGMGLFLALRFPFGSFPEGLWPPRRRDG